MPAKINADRLIPIRTFLAEHFLGPINEGPLGEEIYSFRVTNAKGETRELRVHFTYLLQFDDEAITAYMESQKFGERLASGNQELLGASGFPLVIGSPKP